MEIYNDDVRDLLAGACNHTRISRAERAICRVAANMPRRAACCRRATCGTILTAGGWRAPARASCAYCMLHGVIIHVAHGPQCAAAGPCAEDRGQPVELREGELGELCTVNLTVKVRSHRPPPKHYAARQVQIAEQGGWEGGGRCSARCEVGASRDAYRARMRV